MYKKSCAEGDQLRGGLVKCVRVDTRFEFKTERNYYFLTLLLTLLQGKRFLKIAELNRE